MQKILLGIIGLVVVVGLIVYFMKGTSVVEPTITPTDTSTTKTTQPATKKVSSVTLAENPSGNTATIAHATLVQPSYIVIYRTDAKGDVSVAGNSKLLAAGEYTDYKLMLKDVASKDVLVAVLHGDDGNGTFDFPKSDLPIIENGMNVTSVDVIGVPQAAEDARLATRVEAFLKAQAEMEAKSPEVLEVTVHGANYKFTPNTIKAKEGQKVRVTFISDGGLHDFVIDEFSGARTKQLQGGGTETIEFVASKKGSFKYYCSVGQHRAMGMEGTLTVE